MVTKIKYSPILNSTVMTRAKKKTKKTPPKQPQTRQSNQTLGNHLYNVRQQHNVKQTMISSP